jgi:hypothetical protein
MTRFGMCPFGYKQIGNTKCCAPLSGPGPGSIIGAIPGDPGRGVGDIVGGVGDAAGAVGKAIFGDWQKALIRLAIGIAGAGAVVVGANMLVKGSSLGKSAKDIAMLAATKGAA